MRMGRMVFVYRAAAIGLAAFVATLAGFGLQWLLPAAYLAVSKGIIGSVMSLVASLLSIVLGLLIWTSHSHSADQQTHLQTIGLCAIQLDLELMAYGVDSAAARALLRQQAVHARARFWSGNIQPSRHPKAFNDLLADAEAMFTALQALRPTSAEQSEHLAAARDNYRKFVETQATMIRTLANRVPIFLLIVVLGWSCLLFFGYGLLAGINAMTAVIAALGAAAVASAILVILELSYPYSGLFRVPDWGLEILIKMLSANSDKRSSAQSERTGAR